MVEPVYRSLCPRLDMDARIFLKKILLVYPKIQKLFKILCHMHGVLNINKSIPKSQNFSLPIHLCLLLRVRLLFARSRSLRRFNACRKAKRK